MRYFCYFIFSTIIITSHAQDVQWASKVLDFSTQYGSRQYSAEQVLGPPDKLPSHGSSPNAWAAKLDGALNRKQVKGAERLKVGYKKPMKIQQVVIAENFNPGAVEKVFLFDTKDNKHEVYSGEVGLAADSSRMFNVFFPMTDYKVKAVEIIIQCGKIPGWNEIDAIGISESEQPVKVEINVVPDLQFSSVPENLGININSKYKDLGPVISPDGKTLFFVREAHPKNVGKKVNKNDQDIWVSELDEDDNWQPANNIGSPLNNYGYNFVNAITPDGNTILVGGNYPKVKKKKQTFLHGHIAQKNYTLGTYLPGVSIAHKTAKGWSFPKQQQITNYYNYYNYVSYYLANDGKTLLMSVDRRDSYGERDIYVSFLEHDNFWTEPKNLGNDINTAADDYSPFLAADGVTMYYATSGFATYGNSDIFITKRLDDTWQHWTVPQNLGPQINTSGIDAHYTIPASGKYAYFVSNTVSIEAGRGGFGKEDIFRIKLPEKIKPKPVLMIAGKVIDTKTQQPIEATIIYQTLPEGKEAGRARSHPLDGKYKIVLPVGKHYSFLAEAPGYIGVNKSLKVLDGTINYENLPPIEIFRIGFEEGRRIIITETRQMDDITIKSLHQEYIFDTLSSETIYQVCFQEGKMLSDAGKSFLYDDELKKLISQYDFQNLSAYEIYRLGLKLGKKLIADELENLKVSRTPGWVLSNLTENLPESSNAETALLLEFSADEVCKIGLGHGKLFKTGEEYLLIDKYQEFAFDLELVPVEEGQTVRLNNIFFQYGKAELKKESFVELNRLLEFMKENKSMKIEIAGHTDRAGTLEYNIDLSRKRAQAVANYLIENGIKQERLLVTGYGESKTISTDNTEEGRRLNRRVEFTILKK
ncbi:MAG: OmpA family protein [Cytophagales bacterium]|nr:OmpA family protein [Cytophagales bacterium]